MRIILKAHELKEKAEWLGELLIGKLMHYYDKMKTTE